MTNLLSNHDSDKPTFYIIVYRDKKVRVKSFKCYVKYLNFFGIKIFISKKSFCCLSRVLKIFEHKKDSNAGKVTFSDKNANRVSIFVKRKLLYQNLNLFCAQKFLKHDLDNTTDGLP